MGVQFLDGEDVILGENILATAECLYEGVNYEPLKPDASFFIMEGASKVGEGKIIDRYDGYKII